MTTAHGTTFACLPVQLLFDAHLSDAAVRLFGVLDDYDSGAGAWPSHRTLATRTGWSLAKVRRSIDELTRHGWVVKKGRWSVDGRQKSNLYELYPWRTSEHPPCSHVSTHEQDPLEQEVNARRHDMR